jgi:CRISPR-associated protein Cas6
MNDDPVVDLAFVMRGTSIPADHGYLLYAAIARQAPSLHGDESIGVHPIFGRLTGDRRMALTARSRLILRLPSTRIPDALRLVGQRLEFGGNSLEVGVPTVRPLRPAAAIWSRLVVIKGFMEPTGFLDAAQRQLAAMGVDGQASLVPHATRKALEGRSSATSELPIRRTIRVHDKEVVGFALHVEHLTAEESLQVQETGLGGRRRFGCGVFMPARW